MNDGSIIPGSEHWNADCEWPTGGFGFVWGCYWGDDSSWKVQYLDLSRVQQGVLRREDRFGYVEVATFGYVSPCLELNEAIRPSAPPVLSTCRGTLGVAQVTFAVPMRFALDSGKPEEWQRLKVGHLE